MSYVCLIYHSALVIRSLHNSLLLSRKMISFTEHWTLPFSIVYFHFFSFFSSFLLAFFLYAFAFTDHPINPPGTEGDPFAIDEYPPALPLAAKMKNGVILLESTLTDPNDEMAKEIDLLLSAIPLMDRNSFLSDMNVVLAFTSDGPLKSFCYRRLMFLNSKYQLHVLLNEFRESAEQKKVPHRDFYNIRKVKRSEINSLVYFVLVTCVLATSLFLSCVALHTSFSN